ncbi:adenylosuccinate lyase [Actinokineospora sp. HBU206404]|uniref:Adenylosuccinate lyase n=2 Tax=Actinokineospora xionganensis TaxID=2684470 RepID=A0ABR7L7I2_9PSEU|nr:adenylosuccinate lyase [Actinokineospora xionganensis]
MIDRYCLPVMRDLWTDEAKYASWVRVEVLASRAQADLGVIPREAIAAIEQGRVPTVSRVRECEVTRDHEILAFLEAYTETIPGGHGRWVHYGMTSYDLVDTALGHTLARSCDLMIEAATRLRDVLVRRSLRHWDTVCVARTHGIHAEPTTFGQKMALHAAAVDRCLTRLVAARSAVAVGTISGPVGTYSKIDPMVEAAVCAELGLGVEPIPSQVVARDRHAEMLSVLAVLGAVVEQIGLELRLLQRTEVREVEEPRTSAYQGSSAMPHKRNPTSSERICGLARLLRAYADAGYENVALWHERDLAHSPVERVVFPDAFTIAHYQVTKAAEIVDGMTVFPERMLANLESTRGLIYSADILLDLVDGGMDREKAYRVVQDAAAETAETGRHLSETLADRDVATTDDQFRPARFLSRAHVVRDRMEKMFDVEM